MRLSCDVRMKGRDRLPENISFHRILKQWQWGLVYVLMMLLWSCGSHSIFAASPSDADSRHAGLVEQLQSVEDQLEELGNREREVRDRWEQQNRALMRAQQDILSHDEDVREVQERIHVLLEEVRVLQAQLNDMLLERVTPDTLRQPDRSREELQQQIMELRNQRQDLIREREFLMHQLQSVVPEDDSIDAATGEHE